MTHTWAKGLLCLLLLGGLVFAITGIEDWQAATPARESYKGLADGLFDKWMLPFELLSVLLLAALFGALYLSKKNPNDEEAEP